MLNATTRLVARPGHRKRTGARGAAGSLPQPSLTDQAGADCPTRRLSSLLRMVCAPRSSPAVRPGLMSQHAHGAALSFRRPAPRAGADSAPALENGSAHPRPRLSPEGCTMAEPFNTEERLGRLLEADRFTRARPSPNGQGYATPQNKNGLRPNGFHRSSR
jgi:hypothetical protein